MPACFKLASSKAYLDASLKHAGMTWQIRLIAIIAVKTSNHFFKIVVSPEENVRTSPLGNSNNKYP